MNTLIVYEGCRIWKTRGIRPRHLLLFSEFGRFYIQCFPLFFPRLQASLIIFRVLLVFSQFVENYPKMSAYMDLTCKTSSNLTESMAHVKEK